MEAIVFDNLDCLFHAWMESLRCASLDDVALDLISTDIVLMPGQQVDSVAPGTLNSIADLSIAIAARLV